MRVKGILRGLQDVTAFLNAIGPRTTQAQWPLLFRKLCKQMGLSGFRMTFDEAKLLRRQLHHNLAFLRWINIEPDRVNDPLSWTDDERAFFRADAPLDRPFDDLVDQLNGLQLKTTWQYQPLAPQAKPRDPSQAILTVRWNDGTTRRWTAQAWPVTKTVTDHLYVILGKWLETGALSRLKVCRECEKYIVVADVKRRFCSTKCHDDYHNRETHARNRKHRKERAILNVKRLREEGKSREEIKEETGLSWRAVEKIFAGERPEMQVLPKTAVETRKAIATRRRLQPVITAHYKRMEKLDRKQKLVLFVCPVCQKQRQARKGSRPICYHPEVKARAAVSRKPSTHKPARKSK